MFERGQTNYQVILSQRRIGDGVTDKIVSEKLFLTS